MKALRHESFIAGDDLTKFVNINKIKKSDIQQITNSPMSYHLYYWVGKDVSQGLGESEGGK